MSKLKVNEIEPISGTGIAVGGPPTNSPSILFDLQSTSQGVTLPRMTTAQRNAIPSPVEGLLIYNLDDGRVEQYTSGQWTVVGNGLAPAKNVLRVVKNAVLNAGDFSSINAALASITTNSPTNQYAIEVGPGIFAETQITLKPYVAIIGESALTTTIVPVDPTADLIIASDFSRIERLTIAGVTASGKAAIHSTNHSQFLISKCQFTNNAIGINVTASNILSPGNVLAEECFFVGPYGSAVNVTSIAGALATVLLRSFTVSAQSATASQFFVTGVGAICVLDDLQISGNTGIVGVEFQDGATVRMESGNISGCGTGFRTNNVGSSPIVLMTGAAFTSNTNDIVINHASTMGTVNAAADETKSIFNVGTISSLAIALYDPAGDLIASNVLRVRQPDNTFTDVTTLSAFGAPTGIYTSGDINQPPSGFTVNVEAGLGYLQKSDGSLRKIEWPDTPFTVSANSTTFLYFDSAGTLQGSGIFPNVTQNIFLGRVVTDSTKILIVEESGFQATHMADSLGSSMRNGLGPVYAEGTVVAEVGTRNLNITAGNYYFGELNFRLQGANPAAWTAFYQDGSGGFVSVHGQTVVDNANWDSGTGTLTALGAGNYAKHSIYALGDSTNDFDSEAYFLVYSQAQYTALTLAEQGSLPNPPNFLDGQAVSLVASVIVQQGFANIVEIRDERPLFSSKRTSSVSASTFHHNLLGLNDFDDHLRYLPVNGSRPMTADLPMGTHNVVNAGTYNGVTVENHHARHQPGSGLDELPTAAAVTLTPNQANATGTSTSLSRADHVHNVPTAAPATQTPDQSNADGVATTFSKSDHVHNVPTAIASGLNANSTNTQGSAASFSRSDHTHAIASGIPSTQTPNQANDAGTSTNFARADHIHDIPTGTPSALTPNAGNSQGSAPAFAQQDHIHNVPTAAPANQTIAASASDGAAATFSRSDHLHTFSAAAPVTQNADSANVQGTSTSFARADHVHNIPTATAVDVGSTNSQGSATTLSKADHVHRGVRSLKAGTGGTQRFGDLSVDPGNGTTVTDDGAGNFTVDTTGGANELAVTNGGGLVANYTTGKVRYDGTFTQVAAGSITLTANITNGRIYVDVDGTVKQTGTNTVAPPYTTVLALFTTGVSTITSLVDHRTFINKNLIRGLVGDITADLPDNTASAGTTNRLADAGHQHAIATAAASTQTPNQANAKGTSTSFARADHVHNIPTGTPSTLNATNANAQGSAAAFAQQDHLHAISTGTPSAQTPDQANATGTSANLARADHVHDIPTGTASTISTNANAQGTAAAFARQDHTHELTAGAASQDHLPQYDGSNWQATYPEQAIQPGRAWRLLDEFTASTNTGELNWNAAATGGGSVISAQSTANLSNNHPGIFRITTGANAGTSATLSLFNIIQLGGGAVNLETEINIPTLSTGTQTYAFRFGIGDSNSADFTNGVYFEYNTGISTNWIIKTANGGTRTSTTTSTAVATGWTKLTIQINAAASSVTFFIGGVSVGTITTNIPTATTGIAIQMDGVAGNAAKSVDVDYFFLNQRFTSVR